MLSKGYLKDSKYRGSEEKPKNIVFSYFFDEMVFVVIYLNLLKCGTNKPAMQAAGADPSQCNSTNRKVPLHPAKLL